MKMLRLAIFHPPMTSTKLRRASLLLLLLLLLLLPTATAYSQPTDCAVRDCDCVKSRAFAALRDQDFEGAVTKFAAWKTCDPRRSAEADSMTLVAFRAVDKLRNAAERGRRAAYANDLAYKSKLTLRNGDRVTAFRLAEFAWRYADEENPEVLDALTKALYYNDDSDNTRPLYRYCSLEGHAPVDAVYTAIRSVAFSPDGLLLATASDDKTAKIWDLNTKRELLTLSGHESFVRAVAFSPDSKRVATGAADNTAKIWDAQSGKELLSLTGHTAAISSLVFSHDNRFIVTGSNDKTAKIWDTETGKEIGTLSGHTAAIWSVAVSPNCFEEGSYIATGSGDKTVKIWNIETGKEVATLKGHTAVVRSVSFSPVCSDKIQLASGGEDRMAIVWDIKTGKEVATLEGYNSKIWSVAFSPDGRQLAVGHEDQLAKIWDLKLGKETISLAGSKKSVRSVAFSPPTPDDPLGGRWLATGGYDNSASVWDLTGKDLFTLEGHEAPVRSVVFSSKGQLASASDDGHIKLWNADENKAIKTLASESFPVRCVAFSPDGNKLAAGTDDGVVKILEPETGSEISVLTKGGSSVWSLAFSPSCLDDPAGGRWLAAGFFDKTFKIWNIETGKELLAEQGHTAAVTSVAFSPDGKRLATGSFDKKAKIWDAKSGKLLMTLEGHDSWVMSVAFSPDGRWLATGSDDNTAKIWDLASGKDIAMLTSHQSAVRSVAFSPPCPDDPAGGRWLATGSDDGTAIVWDMENIQKVFELKGHDRYSSVFSVAFSPDGRRLATASDDHTIKIWELNGEALIQRWHRTGCTATLMPLFNDVDIYGLEPLLNFLPDNEAKLLRTGETWQIAAFADLAAQRTVGSRALERVSADYARADRLYRAAHELSPHPALAQKRSNLLLRYADILFANGQPEEALASALEAVRLFPGDLNTYHRARPILIGTLKEEKLDVAEILKSERSWELRLYGDYFFDKEKWPQAGQLYEKAEQLEHAPETLIRLHHIAEKTRQTFDFQRFLNSENAKDLRLYGNYFFGKENWAQAEQLYEKAEQLEHSTETLVQLHGLAERAKRPFAFERFLASDDAEELRYCSDYFFHAENWTKTAQLCEKAERLEHKPETLIRLRRVTEKLGQPLDFQRFLASDNPDELRLYADYFAGIEQEKNKDCVADCLRAAELGEKLLTLDTSANARKTASDYYNILAYNQLFVPDGKAAEASIRRGLVLNPDNQMLMGRLPFALLLQGRYAEAEKMFLELKNQTLDGQTFSERFLEDLKNLEAQGVSHPDFERIKKLLEGDGGR